jgi:hypothetical protein
MSEATILGRIRQLAGGDVNDLSGTILEALDELEAHIRSLAYDVGTWTAASLLNDWGGTLEYTKDSHGWVHLEGRLEGSAPATDFVFTTLPVGMRPASTKYLPATDPVGLVGLSIEIRADGTVRCSAAVADVLVVAGSFYVD